MKGHKNYNQKNYVCTEISVQSQCVTVQGHVGKCSPRRENVSADPAALSHMTQLDLSSYSGKFSMELTSRGGRERKKQKQRERGGGEEMVES